MNRGSVDTACATGFVEILLRLKSLQLNLRGKTMRKSGDEVENVYLRTSLYHVSFLLTPFIIFQYILFYRSSLSLYTKLTFPFL